MKLDDKKESQDEISKEQQKASDKLENKKQQ